MECVNIVAAGLKVKSCSSLLILGMLPGIFFLSGCAATKHEAAVTAAKTTSSTPSVTHTPDSSLRGQKRWTNSLGMKFNSVPETKVLFGIWDVRVKDYAVFAKETQREWPKPNFTQTGNEPAVMVSWNDAIAFCDWLTKKEQATGKLSQNKVYRLPTDAEWSAAVGKGKFPWGDTWPPPLGTANYHKNLTHDKYPHTSPVGSFTANQYGLYDMAGNVYQWCMDWYQASMNSDELRQKIVFLNDDKGGATYKVLRGTAWDRGWNWGDSSWKDDLYEFMSSSRFRWEPTYRSDCFGFRVVVASISELTIVAL